MNFHENTYNPLNVSEQKNIGRRQFLNKCSTCAAGVILLAVPGVTAASANSVSILQGLNDIEDAKKIFIKKGTCSQALFFLLNREFGHIKDTEERAIDPLAGGSMQRGYQCGILWGSAMAAGAESYRRHNDQSQAITQSVKATQHILEAFVKKTKTANCIEITNIDFTKRFSILKAIFNIGDCLRLVDKMAPKLLEVTRESLSKIPTGLSGQILSCASETVRKMGANDEEMVMVAGFAGGFGLSGNACGALSAAIWKNTISWCRKNPEKSPYNNEDGENTIRVFEEATGSEFLCSKISGKTFKSISDHTEYIKCGGCEKLINTLAQIKVS